MQSTERENFIKVNCIFQAGFNDLCQLHSAAEGKLFKYYFSWWVKIPSITSVRWIHSAASDNPLEEPLLRKVSRGQDVVEHPAYQPHPIINWPWIKTGLVSCYLQRVCRLGWVLCLLPCRETGIRDLAVPISSLVRQVIRLLVYASSLWNKVCYLRTPHFYCYTVAEHQSVIAASIQCTGEYLFYKYLHLGLERTFHLFGVSLQIHFHRLGNDLTNLVLCLFVFASV